MAKKKHTREETFADRAKKIMVRYKSRLGENLDKDDPLARKAMERELQELAAEQESVKQSMEMDQVSRAMAYGGGLPKMQNGGEEPDDTPFFNPHTGIIDVSQLFTPNRKQEVSHSDSWYTMQGLDPITGKKIQANTSINSSGIYGALTTSNPYPPSSINPNKKVIPATNKVVSVPSAKGVGTVTKSAGTTPAATGQYSITGPATPRYAFDTPEDIARTEAGFMPLGYSKTGLYGPENFPSNAFAQSNAQTESEGEPYIPEKGKMPWTAYAAPAAQLVSSVAKLFNQTGKVPQGEYNPPQEPQYVNADFSPWRQSAREDSVNAQRSIGGSDQYIAKAYQNKISSDYQKTMSNIAAEENKANVEGRNAYNLNKFNTQMQSAKTAADVQLANATLKEARKRDVNATIESMGKEAAMFPQNIAQDKMNRQMMTALSKGFARIDDNGVMWTTPAPGFEESQTGIFVVDGRKYSRNEYYRRYRKYLAEKETKAKTVEETVSKQV
jgi:hypothetical protein